MEWMHNNLKLAIGAGIGFFIAFVGLKNAGIIIADPSTFVALGNLTSQLFYSHLGMDYNWYLVLKIRLRFFCWYGDYCYCSYHVA